ncbi:MAG: hypothetical protein H8E80_08735 [Desulfobacteraceae bacterium]|uniref:Uncharacterized protein n=1 Tax=Candidatus Desulfaltia bathyphila TaxID=2841697 RepID=A0A8J6N627_9BACT|nr:hypothetical protein [Candidatus Desulfaltia bathyphila]MBL7196339.1 hypothetical protein [Desulfobacterales bacterium]
MKYLILYIASLVLGGAGAWLISRWGTTIGLLDRSNDRSSHKGVVPKGGEIGILAAFLFPFYADELTTRWRNGEMGSNPPLTLSPQITRK